MEEQSEALHAGLTWKDLLRVSECSRSHPHPAQPAGTAPCRLLWDPGTPGRLGTPLQPHGPEQ